MLSGKCWFFALISESQWSSLACDSAYSPAEPFELLNAVALLVTGNGTLPTVLRRQSPKLLTATGLLQMWSQSVLLQVGRRFLK